MADRYWVSRDNEPWQEVDKAGWVSAERSAGFHDTLGQPNEPGTGGFTHTYHPGREDEWNIRGTMQDPYAFDESHRVSMDDCNDDRCPISKSEGQCHLRRGHVGVCDPHGHSHLESSHGTTWEVAK